MLSVSHSIFQLWITVAHNSSDVIHGFLKKPAAKHAGAFFFSSFKVYAIFEILFLSQLLIAKPLSQGHANRFMIVFTLSRLPLKA